MSLPSEHTGSAPLHKSIALLPYSGLSGQWVADAVGRVAEDRHCRDVVSDGLWQWACESEDRPTRCGENVHHGGAL
jgi:hypothetical protein